MWPWAGNGSPTLISHSLSLSLSGLTEDNPCFNLHMKSTTTILVETVVPHAARRHVEVELFSIYNSAWVGIPPPKTVIGACLVSSHIADSPSVSVSFTPLLFKLGFPEMVGLQDPSSSTID